jgi:predicted nucleic acid-binding protein
VKRYLLDTNVISEVRKARPHGAVVNWLSDLEVGQIFISAVTAGELQAGVELTRRQDAAKAKEIEEWLATVEEAYNFLPMDVACFREWSRLMTKISVDLRDDAMIAATARVHGLTVATRNERDFTRLEVKILNPFKSH